MHIKHFFKVALSFCAVVAIGLIIMKVLQSLNLN